ncbi:MAG TPA: response regulator transcription factor [Candidatus Limnocylindria bacterium]|jgi:DNA-binding response OmpR family regulator|nr:response regulator transcription factor [Candidatus Limnocylindria bacterium]
MKVLVVENDRDQLDVTAHMLRRDHFAVIEASDSAQALRRFRTARPDLVVVNLGLPPPGGLELLRLIRAEAETPVLVVIGPNDRQETFRCFELGADDFITKPYVFRELTLRMRAILRRASSASREGTEPRLHVADLDLDPETHEVQRGSLVVRLTPTEFRIFYTLVKNAEHVVPANRLFAYVWGTDGGAANSLRSHICHLRKKLGLDGGAGGSIASVPAVGYVFRASASSASLSEDEPFPGQVAAGP